LVTIASVASELAAQNLNSWSMFAVSLTVPSIDLLLQVISYNAVPAAEVCFMKMFILSMLSVASIAVATVLARSRSILNCHIQTIT